MESEMHAKRLITTALAAAFLGALAAFAAAAEGAPGRAPGDSADHVSTGTVEPPSVTVLKSRAFSAGRCWALPRRIWAASLTLSSIAAAGFARQLLILAGS
jgi:hypothetical protein